MNTHWSPTARSLLAATIVSLSLACSADTTTAPTSPASTAGATLSRQSPRRADHAIRVNDRDLFLDDVAQVVHDGKGRERRFAAPELYQRVKNDFARIRTVDAYLAKAMHDPDYLKCLHAAPRPFPTLRISSAAHSGYDVPAGRTLSASTGAARSLSSSTPATLLLIDTISGGMIPTFCQQAAVGLYQANLQYKAAVGAFADGLLSASVSGATIVDGVIDYEWSQLLAPVTLAALQVLEYAVVRSQAALGFFAAQMSLGGCLNPGAQYGWYYPPTAEDLYHCVTEQIIIEVVYPDGRTHLVYAGDASVCQGE